MTARVVELPVAALAADPIAQADAELAGALADPARVTHPEGLPRIFVPAQDEPSWMLAAAEPSGDREPRA
jgi:hypothetical protein